MSNKLILGLLVIYFIIAIVSLFEKNYTKLEYWIGAILIVHSTLKWK